MSSPENEPTLTEGVPDKVTAELPQLTPDELHNTVIHAQELLQFHDETASSVEPDPNEEILRATKRDGYTEVVKRTTCAEECANSPHGRISIMSKKRPGPKAERKSAGCFLAKCTLTKSERWTKGTFDGLRV